MALLSLSTMGCLFLGCSSFETNLQDTQVDFGETAKTNFDAGEKAMADGRYTEAVKYFDHTKDKYPYSKYAVLAELRTADAHFAREKWLEAADAYRIFVRFHPRHEKVAYATFRTALAHSNEIDQDVWWYPTAVERDQTAARDAIRAFDEFLARFPQDENAPKARELRVAARARLASADLYAAQFYERRRKWQGAMWRYERVYTELADTPKAAFALERAARIAEEELKDAAQSKTLRERLLKEHPASPEAAALQEDAPKRGAPAAPPPSGTTTGAG